MRPKYDLIVVIPIGPNSQMDNLIDTIDSIRHYIDSNHKVVIADDSQKGSGAKLQAHYSDIDVIVTRRNLGKVSGLYFNLSAAYVFALERYDFTVLMKMDDDALVIGAEPHQAAIDLFQRSPNTGMAGRHIQGRFSKDQYGNLHDNYWPRKQLIKDTCSWKLVRRPIANWNFRRLFFNALTNGYELGENIQGGVYFFSKKCLLNLNSASLLGFYKLRNVNFGEDLLFSLLVKSIGMNLGDLGSAGLPVGCAWKGLPAATEVLYEDNKKVIHSVRSWDQLDESDIRDYFRDRRKDDTTFIFRT